MSHQEISGAGDSDPDPDPDPDANPNPNPNVPACFSVGAGGSSSIAAPAPLHAGQSATGGASFSTARVPRTMAALVDFGVYSTFAVQAMLNAYKPGDKLVMIHVDGSSTGFGTDFGSRATPSQEDQLHSLRSKVTEMATPLIQAQVPYQVVVVIDHDMKERICLEIRKLNCEVVFVGKRGFGATPGDGIDKIGSVASYCLGHCACGVKIMDSLVTEVGNGNAKEDDSTD